MTKGNEMGNQAEAENKITGVDHRLLDGYDGGQAPTPEFMQDLLKNAPKEVQERAKQFAQQRQQQAAADKQGTV